MATECSPDKIVSALHEEAEIITDIVREKIKLSDRLALRMIPDGGTVRRHANNDTVIYGEARQASVQYRDLDHSVKTLEAGQFPGRDLHGSNGIFDAQSNQIDDNACHGQTTIDFSQGYRVRRTIDKGLDLDTPIKCARELDRLGESHIRGYFEGFKNQFTRFGLDNFSDNLLNLTIQYSEANASVIAGDQFNVSTGGWSGVPQSRITIHFLKDYRDHVMAELKGRGMEVPEDWMLEVEMPVDDWIDAVREEQIQRNGTSNGTSYNTEWLKDDESAMRGRRFGTYAGIKCYFNETPIRGYFQKVGTVGGNDQFQFTRVYDWINTIDEQGGLITGVNHQYRADTVVVDGVSYNMVTLIPHIDPRSFKRFGLIKPLKPYGTDNAGVNYEVRVIDGARLGCNDFDDKFKFAARHEFRFKAIYPEFSGYIAYLHGRRTGYSLAVTRRDYTGGPASFAGPEAYRAHVADECEAAECAQCGKVAEADGTCVAPESVTASVLGLQPAGAVTTAFLGEAYTLRLAVHRTGGTSGAASVTWTSAHVTTDDTDFLDGTGTLAWAAGDNEPKYVEINILATAVAATDQTFTVTLTSPVGATLATGGNVTTVTLTDLS